MADQSEKRNKRVFTNKDAHPSTSAGRSAENPPIPSDDACDDPACLSRPGSPLPKRFPDIPERGVLSASEKVYRQLKPDLLREHPDEFIVIKEGVVLGTYPTEERALQDAYSTYGYASFFLEQIRQYDAPTGL